MGETVKKDWEIGRLGDREGNEKTKETRKTSDITGISEADPIDLTVV